jgi:hypothetical protein
MLLPFIAPIQEDGFLLPQRENFGMLRARP